MRINKADMFYCVGLSCIGTGLSFWFEWPVGLTTVGVLLLIFGMLGGD